MATNAYLDLPVTGGSASNTVAITPSAYPYTSTSADYGKVILVDTASARTINLPTPVNGFYVTIKDSVGSANTNNITVVRAAAEKIEGLSASFIINSNWASYMFFSNGTDWFLVA